MYVVKTTEQFVDWLNRLRKNDFQPSHRVVQRIKRMAMGNLGDMKAVGGKASEALNILTSGCTALFQHA